MTREGDMPKYIYVYIYIYIYIYIYKYIYSINRLIDKIKKKFVKIKML